MYAETHDENLGLDLLGWKRQLDEVVTSFDRILSSDQRKIVPFVKELYVTLARIRDKSDEFETEHRKRQVTARAESPLLHLKEFWRRLCDHNPRRGHI
jgi:hypothetical protein